VIGVNFCEMGRFKLYFFPYKLQPSSLYKPHSFAYELLDEIN